MEDGPEPQELLEQVEHNQEADEEGHAQHSDEHANKSFSTKCAMLASSLAVLAALSSLMSGHAANEAILQQSEATDQWSYYQARSTKAHIFESDSMLLSCLAKADHGNAKELGETIAKFDSMSKKEEVEKQKLGEAAERTEQLSKLEFLQHQDFSYGVACFQIGIVLASICILVRSSYLFFGSIACGIIGIGLTLMGLIK